ncbi:carboxylate-amine ligase [Yinghuangia soli]|uniref:Putative glutamate--cysteine ligase 2 n=1 Tax=Yinghuangia soli TaxID=2908204 RepID=A0AA41U2V8_9ACTN|nr:glutamate--cysteine ligase [Yinghuangia soli]MCF2531076.1 glutamate--cysteine ligase [Yinghuangia soli]
MTVRLGVEEEFHIVDLATGMPVSAAPGLLELLPDRTFVRELQQSVVETNSRVHGTLDALRADLAGTRRLLAETAAPLGLGVIAAGAPPLSRTGTLDATPTARYERIMEEYAAVADEQQICAAQVHADVPDRDTGVRAMAWLAPWAPVLLALSASSPFWLGADTGYASWRTLVMQRWPSSGPPGAFASAAEYDGLVDELVRSGVITDPGMVYFDIRPSAHQDTLELRICDACPRVDTVVMIAGLFRALVADACAAVRDRPAEAVRPEWLRAATWRAARSGLSGDLLDPLTRTAAPAPEVVRTLLQHVRGTLEGNGDWAEVADLAARELAAGGAAQRLRRVAGDKDLQAVVGTLATETRGPH